MKITIILLTLVTLLGWSENANQLEDKDRRGLPSEAVVIPISSIETESFFSVTMNSPDSLTTGEEFKSQATLTNITDKGYQLEYGNNLFSFFVYDETGKQINPIKKPAILNEKYFKSKETMVEQFSYRLDRPGIYYIEAVAEFIIIEGDEYQLNLGKHKLIVSQL